MEYPCEFYVMDIFEPEWSVAALHDVFQNTPQLFEQFCADLLTDHGFQARVTPYVHDGGYDIELHRDGCRYLAECKCYDRNHSVARPAVQRLVGVNAVEQADGLILMTTGYFTEGAREYAGQTGVILLDNAELTRLCRSSSLF